MKIRVQERIRWSDIDVAGIMYFGNYVRLFEIGETELFREAKIEYSHSMVENADYYMLRVNFMTNFYAPIYMDDEVTVEMFIAELGGASVKLQFSVFRTELGNSDDEASREILCGSGSCTIVCVDKLTRKARRLSEDMREKLQYFVE